MTRTAAEWIRTTRRRVGEALVNNHQPNELLTANEVLDCVVNYFGGVASGYEIRTLVEDIYGVNLEEVQ